MEADEVTEEPQTAMDAEQHPSSKDPSAKDSQELPGPETSFETSIPETSLEPHTSEIPLEPHISESHRTPSASQALLETHTSETPLATYIPETPLEPHTSESHMTPSASQAPLEIHTSETLLEPSIPETSLGYSVSEIPLETPIPETLLETHMFKVPEKHLSFHTSSQGHITVPSSNTLKEDLSEYSSSEVSQTGRSTQISESEILQKHSLSGPSAQVHLDTSAKEKEEEGEDKEQVDATDSTAHTAQPGHQLVKKKGKKGVSRLHIGWRCPHYLWDCFQIGDESKCFCGHLLREHQIVSDISVPCNVGQCRCLMFCFIPSRPEEVGEFWLKRRATFDPKAWRAQCRCKHSHEDHAATGSHSCRVKGCCCNCFESNFLCAACDRRWEEHETFFETEETRRRGGRPHGTDTVNTWRKPL
ncbi:protein FAM221B isoform X2 [Prionailurus bengalensis]|uniref:protein FAM221B isoform X2 n=1 Tax=Prionailurus bengalensis TaxID=37029 RepID=UPI001CA9C242|nr:protein FAM221B isoform X2 [Prionailurus bengalensis]